MPRTKKGNWSPPPLKILSTVLHAGSLEDDTLRKFWNLIPNALLIWCHFISGRLGTLIQVFHFISFASEKVQFLPLAPKIKIWALCLFLWKFFAWLQSQIQTSNMVERWSNHLGVASIWRGCFRRECCLSLAEGSTSPRGRVIVNDFIQPYKKNDI